ncbi:MAG TPA: glycosyltransferase [Thermodesulfobacteriota bacterium]|nr:glycosyltransferase [Thermodesulfobacteriota bacterium]
MAIPRIIHQTYKSYDIPSRCESCRESVISLHPGWEYKFYDDSACREAVIRHFPSFLPVYDRAALIQKTDIFRVIAVYGEGGFYLDLDMECIYPLDDLCEFRCVFGEEMILTEEEAAELGNRHGLRIANYMFGSEPGHPFLLRILKKMADESRREINTENDILESTGPGLVTNVYHEFKHKHRDVALLRNIDRICPVTRGVSCYFGNHARHIHLSSWRWNSDWGNPNLEPPRVVPVSTGGRKKLIEYVEAEINKKPVPEDIFVLRIYDDKPYDGLTTVYGRSNVIGHVINDTKHLSGEKVLVPGMAPFFTDRLSRENTNVAYTTFETTRIPAFWLGPINEYFDHCLVPHPYVKEVFENSGVRIPVTVIQQGFTRYDRRLRAKPESGVFRIGFLGVPYIRKNLFKLYQACVNLLGEIPGLKLVVHSALLYSGIYTREVSLMENSPFVEWTWGARTEEWTAEWYSGLSCYAFPSSGEGWSFTPRESLYMGIPTLLTDIPVHKELIESGYCKAIPVHGKEDAKYEGNTYGQWDRVSLNDIEEAVLDVYRNYGAYLIRAMQGSRWIENKWTNESSQQRLLEFMRSL